MLHSNTHFHYQILNRIKNYKMAPKFIAVHIVSFPFAHLNSILILRRLIATVATMPIRRSPILMNKLQLCYVVYENDF